MASDAGSPAHAHLDAAAGASLHPAAREVLQAALTRGYADPRALHGPGRDARLLLDNAREVVAECLGLTRGEVWFTSPSDAVSRGLLGLVAGNPGAGDGTVLSAVEHAAVRHAVGWHARRRDVAPVEVGVDAAGRVDPAAFRDAAGVPGVAVAALQLANHEVGTRQPVTALDLPAAVPLFVDASASLGMEDLPRDGWAAAAGHATSWGGPPGVGLLLVRRGTRWANPLPGDPEPQDAGGGLPDVAGALAAAAALRATIEERTEADSRRRRLVDRIRAVAATLPDTEVVGDPVDRLPHLVTFSCLYLSGETLVRELDRLGFGVASGSACTASTLEPSHVLAAMGALTHGNVRVSLGRDTTEEQVERFVATLPDLVARLRGEVGL